MLLQEHQTCSELLTLFMEAMCIDNDVWLRWKTFSCQTDIETQQVWADLQCSPLAKLWPMLLTTDEGRVVIELYAGDLNTQQLVAAIEANVAKTTVMLIK